MKEVFYDKEVCLVFISWAFYIFCRFVYIFVGYRFKLVCKGGSLEMYVLFYIIELKGFEK